jgi:N-acetylglucosaminyl-diphospho-decaprenol L-rhamnosyltransferase
VSKVPPSVLVVIVNYRTPEHVVDSLRSLQPEVMNQPGTSVVVVDNASGDHSVDHISAAIAADGWESWASLLPAPTNGGFAYGNNQAIEAAMGSTAPPDLFWLLNPDTVVRPGALRALTEFMVANSNAAICGGGIEQADGQNWLFAFRFPGILSEIERGFGLSIVTRLLSRSVVCMPMGSEPARVDWVSGCTMMIRRETIEQIGMMDEGYFLYFEETDYCLQARRAGLECWHLPDSKIMHIAGQSTGVNQRTQKFRRIPAYWFESRRRYFAKNYGRLYAAVADTAWMLSYCLGGVRLWLQRKSRNSSPRLLTDFARHSALWHSHKTRKSQKRRHPSTEKSRGTSTTR